MAKATESLWRLRRPTTRWGLAGCLLLVYAILTFVYFYRSTGGATGVYIKDGRYFAVHQGGVTRTIARQEYVMFPNLWTRVMSARSE
jgi:hypothetical protein